MSISSSGQSQNENEISSEGLNLGKQEGNINQNSNDKKIINNFENNKKNIHQMNPEDNKDEIIQNPINF